MDNQTSSLSKELQGVSAFSDLPEEALDWLAAHMEVRSFKTGDTLNQAGAPATHMWVILEGEIHGHRPDGSVFVVSGGQIAGMLPYSRLKIIPVTTHAVTPARVAAFSAEFFPEMLTRFPVLGQRLVGVMSDRIRENTRADLQREKLMSLGKLSAGLAHELNNPASAAGRAAEALREAVASLRQVNLQLEQAPLTSDQRAEIARLEQEFLHAPAPPSHDALEQSDREQAVGEWLDQRGVAEAWTIAASLAESGLDRAKLEQVGSRFPADALADILRRISASLQVGHLVDEIQGATARISELVKAIKEYSYMDQALIQEIDLHQGLDSTLIILKHRLKQGVTVSRDYDTTLPRICARAGELNQVWTNLIDNAIDAMQGKGALRIRTAREGDCALVEIVDSGTGIAPEIQGRIFDPFFTTKEVGQGTGLGLDIVHRIVRSHHGDVRFDSRPGETRFQVRLPFQQPRASGGNG